MCVRECVLCVSVRVHVCECTHEHVCALCECVHVCMRVQGCSLRRAPPEP